MALSFAIRKTASKFVPSATKFVTSAPRTAAAGRSYLHHHQTSALFASNSSRDLLQRSFPSLFRHYSTRLTSDESLIRAIESEIQCAEESNESEQGEEIPPGFPFKIEDHPGEQTITLSREYQGENITVEVHMPDLNPAEEDEDDNDEEGERRGNHSSLPLVVRISKNGGPFLEFGCTAYPDEIAIDSLSVKEPEISEEQIAYEGPDFADLDENLQKAFHKYLEIRGIKPSTTNFLHGYMVDKDGREYTAWLKNLHKFFQT